MSRDDGSWRQQQQQQQQQGSQEPGISACVSHYTPVMSRVFIPGHYPLLGPHCVIQYQSSPSEHSAPPQHSNIQQKSDLLTPGLPHSHYTGHCSTQLYSEIDVLIFHCPSILLDPGSDLGVTRRPLRVLAPHLSSVKCIFWKPGVGSRALQHSGILAGREEVR